MYRLTSFTLKSVETILMSAVQKVAKITSQSIIDIIIDIMTVDM